MHESTRREQTGCARKRAPRSAHDVAQQESGHKSEPRTDAARRRAATPRWDGMRVRMGSACRPTVPMDVQRTQATTARTDVRRTAGGRDENAEAAPRARMGREHEHTPIARTGRAPETQCKIHTHDRA